MGLSCCGTRAGWVIGCGAGFGASADWAEDSMGILGIDGRDGLNTAKTVSPVVALEREETFFTKVIPKHLATKSVPRTSITHSPKSGLLLKADRNNRGSCWSWTGEPCGICAWLRVVAPCPTYPVSIIRLIKSSARDRSLAWIILNIVISLSFEWGIPVSLSKAALLMPCSEQVWGRQRIRNKHR